MQTARAQPQYGYVVAGIQKSELSDLAQHHYLVSLIAWYVSERIEEAGGKLNKARLLEICLLHDLGELFGGDIAMPYAKANPRAKELAKAFERENQQYLTVLLGKTSKIRDLFQEANEPSCDEGLVAKIADYIEVTQYKQYVRRLSAGDVRMAKESMRALTDRIRDDRTRRFLKKFVLEWVRALLSDGNGEVFEKVK